MARWLALPIVLLMPWSVSAQEAEGFLEVRGTFSAGVTGETAQVVERVRPSFSLSFSERFALTTTIEAGLAQGRNLQDEVQRTLEESPLGPLMDAAGCVWPTDDNEFLSVSGVTDYLFVERLYIDAYLSRADFRVGRQAVNWGSALLVNPTDPFPEVLLLEPWRPRAGVNAIRTTIPIGEDHDIQAVLGTNDTFTKMRAATRGTMTFGETDVSLVGAYRQESDDGIIGVDVRGSFAVGFTLEGAVRVGAGRTHEEFAVGVDYSFPVLERLLVSAQYYRNGFGTPDSLGGATSLTGAIDGPTCSVPVPFGSTGGEEPDPFGRFFRGRDYAMMSVALGIGPDLSANVLVVQNLNDGSALAVPVISGLVAGWLEVSGAVQVPFNSWNASGELHPAKSDLIVNAGGVDVDLSGLVPDATFIVWSRVSF